MSCPITPEQAEEFRKTGFFPGREVFVNGRPWIYEGSRKDTAFLRDPNTNKMTQLPLSSISRSSGMTAEISPREDVVEKLQRVLPEKEFEAAMKLVSQMIPEEMPSIALEELAANHGFELGRSPTAGYVLRDRETGKVQKRAKNRNEMREYIIDAGAARGMDLVNMSEEIRSVMAPLISPPGPPRTALSEPFPIEESPAKLVDMLASWADWFTPFKRWASAIDILHGTNLTPHYDKTQQAFQASVGRSRPFLNELSAIKQDFDAAGISTERQATLLDYLDAQSVDEIRAEVSDSEARIGEFIANNNLDPRAVHNYMRIRDEAIKMEAKDQGRELSVLEEEAIARGIARDLGMTPEDQTLASMYDDIRTLDDPTEFSLFNAERYASAIQENAQGQDVFAKENELTPQEIGLANELNSIYDRGLKDAGITDPQQVRRVLNYLTADPTVAITPESLKGVLPQGMDLLLDMAKSGELNLYDRGQPLRNIMNLIRGAFKAADFLPAWRSMANYVRRGLRSDIKDRAALERTEQIAKAYLGEIRGIPGASVKATQAAFDAYTEGLGVNLPVRIKGEIVNTILALMDSAMLGFRPGMGIRDAVSISMIYFNRFGLDRTARMWELAVEAQKGNTLEVLHRQGNLPTGLSPLDYMSAEEFAFSTEGQTIGQAPTYIRKIAQAGLTFSLQKTIYELAHVGAFLETRGRALKALESLVEIEEGGQQAALEKVNRELDLHMYDPPTVNEFLRLANDGRAIEAAEFLARQTARDMVFIYGQSNHPYGWSTNVGRIAAQFGTWSSWMIQELGRGLSRGSEGDRMRFAARFAMSQAALMAAEIALGVSLRSWFLLPAFGFAGGPALEQMQMIQTALFGHSMIDQRVAMSRLKRFWPDFDNIAQPYLPGSYFIRDLQRAWEARGPLDMLMRLGGIPERRGSNMLEDLIDGDIGGALNPTR